MEEKYRYKAIIEGKTYTIVGHKSTQHLDAVVQVLNQQLEQLSHLDPSLTKEERAILMAINAISDQIIKEEQLMELEKQLTPPASQSGYRRDPSRKNQIQQKKVLDGGEKC